MKNQNGYSLLELVIVIVIIGVLMAMAIPAYFTLAQKARVATARADVATISQGVELYANLNEGVYPTNLQQLLVGGLEARLVVLPLDPWGNAYQYDRVTHVVSSKGADGQQGGTGYNTDIISNIAYNPDAVPGNGGGNSNGNNGNGNGNQ